jgi:uncharacterized membrane protein YedE/YeeE
MSNFTPWSALAGGALIALGLSGMLLGTGRIAGISGVLGGVVRPERGDVSWRTAFLGGLVVGGIAMFFLRPSSFDASSPRSLVTLAVAGALVGAGTRLSNGCTSGHGVAGNSRLSVRSVAATIVFLAIGVATATLIHVVGRA